MAEFTAKKTFLPYTTKFNIQMHFPANALNKRDLGFEAEVPFVKVKYS